MGKSGGRGYLNAGWLEAGHGVVRISECLGPLDDNSKKA